MICRRCFNLSLICVFWLSANAIAFGQISSDPSSLSKNNLDGMKRIKILVAYQSKYGSTKQYAAWIQQDIKCDLVDIENEGIPPLAKYDIIVMGGYIRAGDIVIAPFIKDHWGVLKGKKVVLFTTSGTPPRHSKIRIIYEKSFPEEIRKEIKYFPLPGRISLKDLTFFDKRLMAIGKMMERDEALKKDMGKDFDGVKRENLLPIVEYLKEIKALLTDENDQSRSLNKGFTAR
jgi:menaquinone-dependent protoporphyrinogen IX oxidase